MNTLLNCEFLCWPCYFSRYSTRFVTINTLVEWRVLIFAVKNVSVDAEVTSKIQQNISNSKIETKKKKIIQKCNMKISSINKEKRQWKMQRKWIKMNVSRVHERYFFISLTHKLDDVFVAVIFSLFLFACTEKK